MWSYEEKFDRREVDIKSKQDRELLNKVYFEGREEGMRREREKNTRPVQLPDGSVCNLKKTEVPLHTLWWVWIKQSWQCPLALLIAVWAYANWEFVRELIG